MRQASRRDENEREIIDIFRAYGWTVYQISAEDFPDLVCGHHGINVLVEVIGKAKLAKYPPHGLSPGQWEFHRDWPGPIFAVRSAAEAHEIARMDY